VPEFQVQPYWYEHKLDDAIDAHGVSVPVQVVE
jgi:hypothetical protein